MFCDLVGSTALSVKLDPEDFHAVLQQCQATWKALVEEHGGHVAQFLGDGLLAYFGYPQSREDDALRAVRAGLRIASTMQAAVPPVPFPPELKLQVRLGIHTGPVVVGEIGNGARRENLALGNTPNLAARLQALAETGTVYISATTLRLVRGRFACQDLGVLQVKGFDRPTQVFRVVREEASGTRESEKGMVREKAFPLVGRQRDLDRLSELWRLARGGSGQVALIQGEAGIGKSCLVQRLALPLAGEKHTFLAGGCSPYYQNTAFYPIVELIRKLLGLDFGGSGDAALVRLEEALAEWGLERSSHLPLWAGLLSIEPGAPAPAVLAPAQLRSQLLASLVDGFVAIARQQPLLLVFEDLHWVDPSSLEVLTRLAGRSAREPILLLLTARSGFLPPLPESAHATQIDLDRLAPAEIAALIRHTVGEAELPTGLLERLVERAEGVPLFAEELTKMVLEVDQPAGWRPAARSVPTTLQSSIEARLDRLGEAKATAQIAAVLGQEIDLDLLLALHPGEEKRVRLHLDRLVEAEMVGWTGRSSCRFRHALIRDAVYESLLHKTRPLRHQAVVRTLESRFPEIAAARPELLAQHCAAGDLVAPAIRYWHRAGQNAANRSANLEASRHLAEGLSLLARLAEDGERDVLELSLQTALGSTLMALKGFAAPEVEAVYRRAFDLSSRLPPTPQKFSVLLGLTRIHGVRAELTVARQRGEDLVAMAEAEGEPAHRIVAHLNVGITLHHLAEHQRARGHLSRAVDLMEENGPVPQELRYGTLPELHGRAYLGFVLWHLGFADQALRWVEDGVERARKAGDPLSLAIALNGLALVRQFRREAPEAQRVAASCMELASAAGVPLLLAMARTLHGWGLAYHGGTPDPAAVEEVHQGILDWDATGSKVAQTAYLGLLAELYGRLGKREEAFAAIARAEKLSESTGERFSLAELHRLRGELALATGDPAGAESWLRSACRISHAQGARLFFLRAATALARLWRETGRETVARRLLTRALRGLDEGFATPDLVAGRALLAELTAGELQEVSEVSSRRSLC